MRASGHTWMSERLHTKKPGREWQPEPGFLAKSATS